MRKEPNHLLAVDKLHSQFVIIMVKIIGVCLLPVMKKREKDIRIWWNKKGRNLLDDKFWFHNNFNI